MYQALFDSNEIKASNCPSITKVVPVFLHVLDLQLVPSLGKYGFGILLEAPGQKTSLPRSCIYSAIHVEHN